MLRGIDRYLDRTDLRRYLAPPYGDSGRPSVDPEVMIRMLLAGYCFGIRSERRLGEDVHLNPANLWLRRVGLETKVPDPSCFSMKRHGRFRENDVFHHAFESVAQRCMTEKLVASEGFAVGGSSVKADANRGGGPSEDTLDRSARVQAGCK